MAKDESRRSDATMRWFTYDHLPEHLKKPSLECAELALRMQDASTENPELTAGLRKLLEAKDCFVRAAILTREAHEKAI